MGLAAKIARAQSSAQYPFTGAVQDPVTQNPAGQQVTDDTYAPDENADEPLTQEITQARSPVYRVNEPPRHFQWTSKDVIYQVHIKYPPLPDGSVPEGQFSELSPFELQIDPSVRQYALPVPPTVEVQRPIFEVITRIQGGARRPPPPVPFRFPQPQTVEKGRSEPSNEASLIDPTNPKPAAQTCPESAGDIETSNTDSTNRGLQKVDEQSSSVSEKLSQASEPSEVPQPSESQQSSPLLQQAKDNQKLPTQQLPGVSTPVAVSGPPPQPQTSTFGYPSQSLYPPSNTLPFQGSPYAGGYPASRPPQPLYYAQAQRPFPPGPPIGPTHSQSHPTTGPLPPIPPYSGPRWAFYPAKPTMTLGEISITHIFDTRLRIWSPLLVEELKAFEGMPIYFSPGSEIIYPYYELLRSVRRLRELAQFPASDQKQVAEKKDDGAAGNPDPDKCREKARQFQCLLDLLEPVIESVLRPAEEEVNRAIPMISHKNLWYIFPPGTDVYMESDLYPGLCQQVYVCDVVRSGAIMFCGLAFDGTIFGYERARGYIPSFAGEKEITSLNICPVKYWDARYGSSRQETLVKLGKMYHHLAQKEHREMFYDGPIAVGTPGSNLESYRGNVIVDILAATALESLRTKKAASALEGLDFTVSQELSSSFSKIQMTDERLPMLVSDVGNDDRTKVSPSDRAYALMNHFLAGYGIKEKKCLGLLTNYLSEIKRVANPLAGVVIDPDDIHMIKAMSFRQKTTAPAWNADFMEGKGLGQIVLLHGPPGVGKTYTVECIAESFERPLLSLTIASIGTTEEDVEEELDRWFSLAERWEAIILIDEADVFLERRSKSDLERNALVATFLRKMEYFKGLLFLTTNRVAQIDDAFASRIHVVIGYERLNDKGRAEIWNNFFQKLLNDKKGKLRVGREAQRYVIENADIRKREWNGREIRNALQTAIALAEFDASLDPDRGPDEPVIVQPRHFNQVMKMSRAFQKYMFAVSKEDEANRAYSRRERADFFKKYPTEKNDEDVH